MGKRVKILNDRYGIIENICIAITFKCNLECEHCFLECGPNNTKTMNSNVIETVVKNSAPYCKKFWISGGEPTVELDLLKDSIRYANMCKRKYGFPESICLQTNAIWNGDKKQWYDLLVEFFSLGVTDIDITSNDEYHLKQIGYSKKAESVAMLAKKIGLFNSITFSGSPEKELKPLGRAEKLKEKIIQNHSSYCNCNNIPREFLIHPGGEIFVCKWAKSKSIGNITTKPIVKFFEYIDKSYAGILYEGGPLLLAERLKEKYDIDFSFDYKRDICLYCCELTELYSSHDDKNVE